MSRLTLRRSIILLVAVGTILSLPSVSAIMFVDRCIDAGGVVNYVAWTCSMNHSFPNPPTGSWLRAPTTADIVVAAAVVLAFGVVFATVDRRQRGNTPHA